LNAAAHEPSRQDRLLDPGKQWIHFSGARGACPFPTVATSTHH
jgi:hypothetical protein